MESKPSLDDINYYYITSEDMDMPAGEQVSIALDCGVKMIQYRNKTGTGREMYREAMELKRSCSGRALFIVNDRIDIALLVKADGVHLGQEDIPGKIARRLIGDMILGISTHDPEQAKKASKIADYIGIGPAHKTATKKDAVEPLGVQGVLDIARTVDVPTAAIGGITKDDIAPLAQEVDMLCVISRVCIDERFTECVKHFEKRFYEEKRRYRR